MPDAAKEKTDIDAIAEDIAALKRDFAALAAHVKESTIDRPAGAAREATAQLGEEAAALYSRLAAEGARTAESLGRRVEQQPFTSLLIAFAAGFLGGRLLSR
jgi:ElaB/YqjD/DUF883 family membrane-anchored ribosome-binding protein